jgi:hypothetical protein
MISNVDMRLVSFTLRSFYPSALVLAGNQPSSSIPCCSGTYKSIPCESSRNGTSLSSREILGDGYEDGSLLVDNDRRFRGAYCFDQQALKV